MDELELLKKDWQKKEEHLPRLSYDEIYKMIWKKSSSIVKWIFYISIAEFLFWIAIRFAPIDTEEISNGGSHLMTVIENSIDISFFLVILFFMFQFYKNYKKISATDSSKELMKKILKTRRTVMRYVWFNLAIFAITMVVVFIEVFVINPPQNLRDYLTQADSSMAIWLVLCLIFLVVILVFGAFLWGFYKVLYGILLRRLNANYKELKKLEI